MAERSFVMKKRQYIKISCSLLLALMMALSGCGADQQNNVENTSTAVSEDAIVEEEVVDEEDLYEFKYTDLVLDRSKTEGKLAVYFLRGNDIWTTWRGGEHDGDSIFVIAPDGTTMLYDANTPNHGANIVYALQRLGIKKIDYFVNSHPHIDHLGGFPIIAKNFEIGHVYTSAKDMTYVTGNNGRYWRKMMSMIDELGIPHSYLQEGDTFTLGEDVQVKVYNPPSQEEMSNFNSVNENHISVLLKLTYGESSYLMGGDIEDTIQVETRLVEKYGSEIQADIAKANHHMMPNSAGSISTEAWLETIDAKVWVGQMSTLPDDFEYFRFRQLDATILHTSLDGAVVISTTGDGTYDVQMEKDHPSEMYGSLDAVDGYMRIE